MKRLCVGADEEQMLLRAFTGTAAPAREEPVDNDAQNAAEERERVERWLEARTQAITFKKAVGRELDKASVTYRRDVCEGIASVDYLIEHGGMRIAVECKFNIARDFEKTVGIAQRLHELLRCDSTVIVVPFIDTYADQALALAPKIIVKTPAELVSFLEKSA